MINTTLNIYKKLLLQRDTVKYKNNTTRNRLLRILSNSSQKLYLYIEQFHQKLSIIRQKES